MTAPELHHRALRRSAAVYFASYGMSLLGKSIAGAALAGLAGVTAVLALAAPTFRSLDDPRAGQKTLRPLVAVALPRQA